MREVHIPIVRAPGCPLKRLTVLAVVIGWVTLVAAPWPARSTPDSCPPLCDSIPGPAWPATADIPLDSVYHWPALARLAVPAASPRFRFEELCATPAVRDARAYTVAGRVVAGGADGQWRLQAQVLHWRGQTWRAGQDATAVFDAAVAALRACQQYAPQFSPSITTDEPDRMAAVISGPLVVHQYLVVHPRSSTISELALWTAPSPQVEFPVQSDDAVLDAITRPLCEAYLDSCG